MSNRVSSSDEWGNCTKCLLSEDRRRVVLRDWGRVRKGCLDRGGRNLYWNGEPEQEITAGLLNEKGPFILFIGEAPGAQEDITGLPFQGRAGFIFNWCLSFCETIFHFEVTNIVGCRPTKWGRREFSVINRQPTEKEMESCQPRLTQLTKDVNYDGIVYLGKVAQNFPIPRQHNDKRRSLPSLVLIHPAKILRQEYKLYDVKEFALKLDRFVRILS